MKIKWSGWIGYPIVLVPVGFMAWYQPVFAIGWTLFALVAMRKEC